MIELQNDQLVFSFPEVHPHARLRIDFQRTLRIPDDGKTYPLPPGLGRFPLRHVDDCHRNVPAEWLTHGGIMLPMYQSEALVDLLQSEWDPDRRVPYPFAIKVATGKINAVSGTGMVRRSASQSPGLRRGPRATVAGRVLRRKGPDSAIRRHAARRRVLGRGANHRKGRARRIANLGSPDEGAKSSNGDSRVQEMMARQSITCVACLRVPERCACRWAWRPAV